MLFRSPGYRKDGDDCIACDADHYCPTKEDLVLKCPPNTWSPIASGEVSECWCHEGFYGKDPSLQHGADCHPCPADKFCAGNFKPMDCPPEVGVSDCLKFPYAVQEWPGEAHDCPDGSSTRGLEMQVNCTCLPGYWKHGDEHLGVPCRQCDVNTYCFDGIAEIPCGAHERSPAGSSSKVQCLCVHGYEHVDGVCLTTCVAHPGQYCEPTPEIGRASCRERV